MGFLSTVVTAGPGLVVVVESPHMFRAFLADDYNAHLYQLRQPFQPIDGGTYNATSSNLAQARLRAPSFGQYTLIVDSPTTTTPQATFRVEQDVLQAQLAAPPAKAIRVLFIGSASAHSNHTFSETEFRHIREQLRTTPNGDQFELAFELNVEAQRLPALIMNHRPHILHFSGHGTPDSALVFEGSHGKPVLARPESIAKIFELVGGPLRLVVLNACYSEGQAALIAQHVDTVIGLSGEIDVEAGAAFAAGLYQAIGYGQSVANAFRLATLQIELGHMAGHKVPVLHVREGVDPENVTL